MAVLDTLTPGRSAARAETRRLRCHVRPRGPRRLQRLVMPLAAQHYLSVLCHSTFSI
jgi:hypothetical protein